MDIDMLLFVLFEMECGKMENLDIGKRIRELRFKHEVKQEDLAQKIGIARITLSNYERNTRQASLEIINKIAKAFDLTLVEFLEPELSDSIKKFTEVLNDPSFNRHNYNINIEPFKKYQNKFVKNIDVKDNLKNILKYLELTGLYSNDSDIEDLEKNVVNTIKYESYKKINNL